MNSFKLFFIVSEKFLMKEDKKIRREEKMKQSREGCCAVLCCGLLYSCEQS